MHIKAFDPVRDHSWHTDEVRCIHCMKWFSQKTNASGWIRHLKKHGILDPDDADRGASESQFSGSGIAQPTSKQLQLVQPISTKEREVLDNDVVDLSQNSLPAVT
jgi:hypothetical protein